MIRFLFLLHRYLGIGIGLVMLLWTLSGIIMMYKSYPELDRWESLSLRDEIQIDDCTLRISVTGGTLDHVVASASERRGWISGGYHQKSASSCVVRLPRAAVWSLELAA